jgi:hypothetical protein
MTETRFSELLLQRGDMLKELFILLCQPRQHRIALARGRIPTTTLPPSLTARV